MYTHTASGPLTIILTVNRSGRAHLTPRYAPRDKEKQSERKRETERERERGILPRQRGNGRNEKERKKKRKEGYTGVQTRLAVSRLLRPRRTRSSSLRRRSNRPPRSRLKVWAALLLLPACTLTYIRWNRVWRLEATRHRRPTSPKKSTGQRVCVCVCMLVPHELFLACAYANTRAEIFTLFLSVSINIAPYRVIHKCTLIFQKVKVNGRRVRT